MTHLQILQAVLTDSQQRIKKENDAVFFQKPPQQLPEAPALKRLVAPAPYALPQMAPGVKEGVASFAAAPAAAVAVEVRRACLPNILVEVAGVCCKSCQDGGMCWVSA